MSIQHNIEIVNHRIEEACRRSGRSVDEVTLVAITKTVDAAAVREAFEAGVRHFGENRIQEAQGKLAQLKDIHPPSVWHMVGHLQTNKAKTALSLFDIIQSVDSIRLAEILSRQAMETQPVLLEVNVGAEVTKDGFSPRSIEQAVSQIAELPNLRVDGLMTVAPWASDPAEVRDVFRQLRDLRDRLNLRELSMGMTGDFEVAIEEGATLIRVGRAIFGERRS